MCDRDYDKQSLQFIFLADVFMRPLTTIILDLDLKCFGFFFSILNSGLYFSYVLISFRAWIKFAGGPDQARGSPVNYRWYRTSGVNLFLKSSCSIVQGRDGEIMSEKVRKLLDEDLVVSILKPANEDFAKLC